MEIGELTFIGFCSLAAINALFFAVYVTSRREKNLYATALLSAFMIIIAYRIIQMLLHDLQEDFNIGLNLRSFIFYIPTFPLAGPFLYLYIRSVSDKEFCFRMRHLLHLIPFLLVMTFEMMNREFLQRDTDQKFYVAYSIEVSAILIQFLAYLISSFIYLKRLNNRDETLPIKTEDTILLRNIVITISVLWIVYALFCIQIFIKRYLAAVVFESIYYSILSYSILFVELRTRKITSINNPAARYKASGLSSDDAARYKSMILEHINRKELYKDHNITLGKFSRSLSLTPHIVSQVINEQLSCNFNDFINSYRVEEAKKMLKDAGMKNYTVASIAYDCGFNTLSAFNTAFKKFTGITPSQFRTKWQ